MRDSSDWNGRVSRINSRNRCTENFAKSLNTFRKIRKKAKERNIIIRRITC